MSSIHPLGPSGDGPVPTPTARWSLQDYERWLQHVYDTLEFYVQERRPIPKGVTRFRYLESSVLTADAWLRLTPEATGRIARLERRPETRPAWREDFLKSYRSEYESATDDDGRCSALVELARDDREAIRESFVSDALFDWRRRGLKHFFDRFMAAYWDERGHRKADSIRADIRRDQRIWRDYVPAIQSGSTVGAAQRLVADQQHMGLENVRKVVKRYRQFYDDDFSNGGPSPAP
jgi:hypothetical protein